MSVVKLSVFSNCFKILRAVDLSIFLPRKPYLFQSFLIVSEPYKEYVITKQIYAFIEYLSVFSNCFDVDED